MGSVEREGVGVTTAADPTIAVVHGVPQDGDMVAVLIKRSYHVGPGRRPSLHQEQLPLHEALVPGEAEPPRAPAPRWDSDHFAFKRLTDLVVQGRAYTADGTATSTEVRLAWRGGERALRVHGDRRLERDSGGNLRFSAAEPFGSLPLGWDRAFGGCDVAALAEEGDRLREFLGPLRPEWSLETSSPFHYPRNPSGIGYCVRPPIDPCAIAVPNVEFIDEPLTPERLVVDGPKSWMAAPLPAGMDWYEQGWFPRCACLGLVPDYLSGARPRECELGWAPQDLLTLGSLFDLQLHPDFAQGAPPGMRLSTAPVGDRLGLHRLWPGHESAVIELPDERPRVDIKIPGGKGVACTPHLTSVVLQPESERAVLVWSCRAPVRHRYTPDQLAGIVRRIAWKR
jgi:hypothetical protein